MSPSSKPLATADIVASNSVASDLQLIVTAIANSPIVSCVGAREPAWSDWENVRQSPNVDEIVLAWIASHVRAIRPASLL